MPPLNPRAPSFIPSSASFYYYHVTRQENLAGIKQHGMLPKMGGSKSGMSNLLYSAQSSSSHLGPQFLLGSCNKLHFAQDWEAVERYVQHMFVLNKKKFTDEDNIPLACFPTVLRCHLVGAKGSMSDDPDDKQGLTYPFPVPVEKICILVAPKVATGNAKQDTDYEEGKNCAWLPISLWQESKYTPAYPDHPNWPTAAADQAFASELQAIKLQVSK